MSDSLLFEHQHAAAEYIARTPRAYLADDPGLGKTRAVIAGLLRSGTRRPLIVCPAIVRSHWWRELDTLDPVGQLEPVVHSFDEIVRGGFPLMAELLSSGAGALVVDEAHYCKHGSSKRAKLLLGKDGYARRLGQVVLASGTPMPKHPGELFTQLCYLRPDVLAEHGVTTPSQWAHRFCIFRPTVVRGQRFNKVVGAKNVDELREIIGKVMLRRTLADVGLDVPSVFWQTVLLNSDQPIGEEFAETQESVKEALWPDAGRLSEIARDPHVARMRRRLGELKVAPVLEMLRSQLADSNEQVVVFAHHHSVLDALELGLGPFGLVRVDGRTPQSRRDEAITRFQTDPRCRVFLGQTIACQTGITLTAANRVVLVEPDWTAMVNAQAAHRVARIGQTADRCVAQLVALANTVDDAIVRQIERETKLAADVFGREAAA